ncbi:MAG: beta-glucanase (GH16 family) [Paraglaciecola sp.]|jgi:beta-glucanase (GH16 family)
MKIFTTRAVLMAMCTLIFFSVRSQCPNIVWADEFSGNSLNLNNWDYQTGDGCGTSSTCGWGNNELQDYTTNNVVVSNGTLQIIADREVLRGNRSNYTSGRIRSINKGDWTYGRFEARIKLPQGGGLWPAFWMLSTNEPYGGWPQSGEIDIMEFVGNKPDETLGYIHYGDPYPDNQQQGTAFAFNDENFLSQFHEFAVEWNPNEIKWFVDGNLFQTKTAADLGSFNWPFDQDMHFLLNVAIGGNLGGVVDNTIFPATMEVEYVRVYDGGRPYVTGDRFVEYEGQNSYSIGNVSGNTNVTWTVPAGATIVSGQGTPNMILDWGTTAGTITAAVSTACGVETLVMNTNMAPPYAKEFSFENFDETGNAAYVSSDGALTEVANPAPNAINGSALSAEYVRSSTAQFDNIVFGTPAIADAAQYVFGDKRFYMDVYTAAPVGTEIIIQLETDTSTPSNFPDGRHSRYFGKTREVNSWHRVYFDFTDRPDFGAAPDNAITKLLVLFNSNTFTGDTYYFDNLDSYILGTGGPVNSAPTVSITAPGDGSSFADGTNVSIAAAAADSDGSVSQVEFFVNGNSVGVDTSSPYDINWTIGVGTYDITAVATDNESASTTSSGVTVTGQSSGPSNEVYVSSIVTGTQSAGRGNSNGTATVTILDNNGSPVANASVTGTFSGTFTETASGTTGSNGTVTVTTSGSAKGGLVVNFCVDDVTHGSLTYNSLLNLVTCTGASARMGETTVGADEVTSENIVTTTSVETYPNPFVSHFVVRVNLAETSSFAASIVSIDGRVLDTIAAQSLTEGQHSIQVNLSNFEAGIYFLQTMIDGQKTVHRVVKN